MSILRFASVLALLCILPLGFSQTVTSTSLSISAGGSVVTTSREGTAVTLTATVTLAGGAAAAPPGQVNFCEVKASPLQCTDIRLLGTVQLSAAGTASYIFFPGPGAHTYQAVFLGTHIEAASASSGVPLSVTPYYPTITTLASSGTQGDYTLTATVTTTGGSVPPTGSVTFMDTSNANYVLATTSALVPIAATYGLDFGSVLSLPNIGTQNGFSESFATADFNGDGKPDLATTSGTGTTGPLATVVLDNGDGTFRLTPNLPSIGLTAGAMALADFNGDGKPDMAFSAQVPGGRIGETQILLGNGDGTFTLGQNLGVGGLDSVATGDFNGDGIPDLVVPDIVISDQVGTVNTVSLLLGNGDGTFTLKSHLVLPGHAVVSSIAVADFNGDGKADLALTDEIDNVVIVWLGNGDGTFTPVASVPTGAPPWVGGLPPTGYGSANSIVAADLNGDGKLDLAVGNTIGIVDPPGYTGSIAILLGNGDGTFAPSSAIPLGVIFGASGLALGDFNGDGKADLAIDASYAYMTVAGVASVLLGNGDGTFAPEQNSPVIALGGLVAADFNGDGLTDLALFEGSQLETLLSEVGPQSATATVSGISVVGTGTHQIDASYSGDSDYQPSVSATIGVTAEPVPTTLALTASPATINYGQQVTLTATLTPSTAQQDHLPTGTVTFSSGSTVIGAGTPTNGVVTFTTATLPSGTNSLTAAYSGDTNFAASTSPAVTETIIGYGTSTSLAASPNPAFVGQTVTLTVAVAELGTAYSGTPAGTVEVYDGTAQIAQLSLDSTGHAVFSTGTLAVGSHSVTAAYSGNAAFYASTSLATTLVVNILADATTLTVSPNPASLGQTVTLSAAVAGTGFGSSTTPSGAITFYDGATVLGAGTLDATGRATYATSALALGTHTLTAVYAGSAVFAGSTSNTVSEGINILADATTLSVSPNPAGLGQTVTLSAAVAGTGFGASSTPSGAITFYDGAVMLAAGTLDATGHATYTTSTLALGTHTLTAVYGGSAVFAGSTSNAVAQIEVKLDFAIALSNPAITLQTYQHTTTTVTLTPVGAFTDSLTLACVNPPAYVTCIFTPSPAALTGNGTAAVSFYIDTDSILGGDGLSGPFHASRSQPPSPIGLALLLPPLGSFALFACLAGRRRRGVWPRRLLLWAVVCVSAPAMLTLAGCGGDVISPVPSAAPGTYIIPVTATGALTGRTHTAQLTLTVSP